MNKKVYHKAAKKIHPLHQMQLMELKKKATEQAALFSVKRLLGMSAYVMRNNFGFGKKRLEQLTELLLEHLRMFEQGEVTMKDYDDILRDECGINFIELMDRKTIHIDVAEKEKV